jgi:hypothetical protein
MGGNKDLIDCTKNSFNPQISNSWDSDGKSLTDLAFCKGAKYRLHQLNA